MIILAPILLTLLFIAELFVLGAFGYWGYHAVGGFSKYGLSVALPLLVAIFWGMFLSPKASFPLPTLLRTFLQLIVFAAGALALYSSGHHALAIIFLIVASIDLLIIRFLDL